MKQTWNLRGFVLARAGKDATPADNQGLWAHRGQPDPPLIQQILSFNPKRQMETVVGTLTAVQEQMAHLVVTRATPKQAFQAKEAATQRVKVSTSPMVTATLGRL
jgi:hypothetical protein